MAITTFRSSGQFLKAVGTEGSGPLQFQYPVGIAFNARNSKMYVTDDYRVQTLT